ncbi:glycosyltransferase family 4 protein [Sporomusa rhizae]|uniref:glycosyltransferase family 4 protein n=1 Tax=Sporomusa rhizae TaxID=357999 RepID=UPI00352A5ACF
MNRQLKIKHIITGLSVGGAEMMLYKLLAYSKELRENAEVISLTTSGPIGERIKELGVPVRSLNMKQGKLSFLPILKLIRCLYRDKPDLVQTWMYHSDLIGGLAAKLAGRIPVIWGIRHSSLKKPPYEKPNTLRVAKFCAYLSNQIPAKIICCSTSSMKSHIEFGYKDSRIVVIPNGFDTLLFDIDIQSRVNVRRNFGIGDDEIVIGMVARYHPLKDYENLLLASEIVLNRGRCFRLVLCGDGVDSNNQELNSRIKDLNLHRNVILLGRQKEVEKILPAFDIFVLSSCGEGFPNVVGEAMSCGLPCVVTDVGDAALIVGDTGLIVPPKSPIALAEGLEQLILMSSEQRKEKGLLARKRIKELFSLTKTIAEYEEIYKEVASHVRNSRIY